MTRTWDNARRWKEAKRKADWKNAEARRQAYQESPLFADQMEITETTAEEEYWKNRFHAARCHADADEKVIGENGLRLFQGNAIRRLAQELTGPDFAALDAYCQHTYPGDYWRGFWRRVLTGHRIELEWSPITIGPDGRSRAECTRWYQHQHMTDEQFNSLFPHGITAPEDHPAGQELDRQLEAFTEALQQRRN